MWKHGEHFLFLTLFFLPSKYELELFNKYDCHYLFLILFLGMTYNEKVDVFSFGIVMCEV